MRRLNLTATFVALATGLLAGAAQAQPAGCDQGVVRMSGNSGTVIICSALAAKVPQLSQQLGDAVKALGAQQAEIRELTRLVKGLNAASANIGVDRQARMLASLSSELARAQRAGGDRAARTVDDLNDQMENFRDQLIASLGDDKTAAATRTALHGPLGDSIANLEFRSAGRQLDDITQRLQALQSDMTTVKAGVQTANDRLVVIQAAVDPARAADRCADLDCAIEGGASAAAVQRLLDKGARLPGDRLSAGELLHELELVPNTERFRILDLLAQRGLDREIPFLPNITDPRALTPFGAQLAQQFDQTAPANRFQATDISRLMGVTDVGILRWNDMVGCLSRTSGGLTLMEFAAFLGDRDMVAYLRQHQVALPSRPLACKWLVHSRVNGKPAPPSPVTTVAIDVASGKVTVAGPP